MKKIPIIMTPDYTIYAEHFDHKVWIHSDVHKWTARIKEQYKEYLDFVLDSFKKTVYAVNEEEGYNKRAKFMKIVGFEFDSTRNFGNGEIRDVYRRDYRG